MNVFVCVCVFLTNTEIFGIFVEVTLALSDEFDETTNFLMNRNSLAEEEEDCCVFRLISVDFHLFVAIEMPAAVHSMNLDFLLLIFGRFSSLFRC